MLQVNFDEVLRTANFLNIDCATGLFGPPHGQKIKNKLFSSSKHFEMMSNELSIHLEWKNPKMTTIKTQDDDL